MFKGLTVWGLRTEDREVEGTEKEDKHGVSPLPLLEPHVTLRLESQLPGNVHEGAWSVGE